jgi:ADP-ribose pyrophosphatase YjhB (NUDIX family)
MAMANNWKEGVARLVRRQPFRVMLAWGVRAAVPRQRVGVALVAFNANEEVFLLKHVFHPATAWGLPGGWLARDEAPAHGVARELREETGLSAVIGPAVCVAHESFPAHIALAYLGWIVPGPMALNAEVLEGRWFAAHKLPQPLAPFTQRAIAAARPLFRELPRPAEEALPL